MGRANSMPMPSTTSAVPSRLNRTVRILAVLAALTLAVYGQLCLGEFHFISMDDNEYVAANTHVAEGLTLENVKWAFTALHSFNWHPLTWMSLQLDRDIFGSLSPQGFHTTNVFLHLANVWLLFWVLERMTAATWRCGAVAAIFAVHPAHVESVAWVAERKDVLSTFFWLLTMLAYVGYAQKPDLGRYLLVLLPFALGLMAKQMLVTLPAVLLLLDYWPLQRWRSNDQVRNSFRWLVAEKLPLFATSAAVVPLTLRAQTLIVKDFTAYPLIMRAENSLVSYVRYIGMMLWPANLSFVYAYPIGGIPAWQAAGAGVLLAMICALVIWLGRSRPYLPVGWFWYLGTLVPVIGLVQVGEQSMADRYTYVPSIGLSILAVWGVADIAQRWRIRAERLAVAAGVLLAVYIIIAFIQVRYWQNSETLYRRAIDVNSNNPAAHILLGDELARQRRLRDAEKEYRECVRIDPTWLSGYYLLAGTLEQTGRLDEAAQQLEKALQVNPNVARIQLAMGHVRHRQNRLDEAHRHISAALHLQPESVEARYMLANVCELLGQWADAREQYEAVLASQPASVSAHAKLGNSLRRLGMPAEAVAHFDAALQQHPDLVEALNGKGLALESLGCFADAAACYQRLVDQEPRDLVRRCNLAFALAESGDEARAAEQYADAFRLNPSWPRLAIDRARRLASDPDTKLRNGPSALRTAKMACQATSFRVPEALDVLAAAYAETGRFDEAVRWEQKAVALEVPDAVRTEMHKRLKLYQERLPNRAEIEKK
jgi:tetratricopeptide (TPR) repeat protein